MPRFLHTMIRVASLERSIAFYTELLGMSVLRKSDYPEDRFTLVFLGFTGERDGAVLELTFNYPDEKTGEPASYKHGSYYGHVCIGVEDVVGLTKRLREAKADVTYASCEEEGGSGGTGNLTMTFVRDPDGYEVEILNTEEMVALAERDYVKQGTAEKVALLRAQARAAAAAAESKAAAAAAAAANQAQ